MRYLLFPFTIFMPVRLSSHTSPALFLPEI